MEEKNYFISIVVPVYNSATSLASLCERVDVHCKAAQWNYELVLVDDGSADQSWAEIKRLKSIYPAIHGVRLHKNMGQHKAILCGLANAGGEWIATMDDDLQFLPEDIQVLLDCAKTTHADMVYGMPEKKQNSFFRNLGSKTLSRILMSYASLPAEGSSFKLIHHLLAQKVIHYRHPFLFVDEVLCWNAKHLEYITVSHKNREVGKSNYSFFSLLKMGMKLIINYTNFPLRLITYFGLFAFIVCLGIIAYFIYNKYANGAELGFTSLIVSIFMSTGLILFCIGVIGEYLNRIFILQSEKPLYVIKEKV
jgi:glycosyltransferase involved in cell wall biosynthesis